MSTQINPGGAGSLGRRLAKKVASVAAAVAVVAAGIVAAPAAASAAPVAPAAGSQGCSYGSGGPKADALCWVDFAEFGNVPASEVIAGDVTKSMTVSLGRYTVTFDATITKGDDGAQGVFASALPTWGGSVLGNPGLPGSPYYVGTTGKPSLYQYMYDGANNNGGLRDTITLSDIKVQDTVLNQPVTSGYSLVMADAESTDEYEGFHWTSDAKLTEYTRVVPPGWTEPCGLTFTGIGTNTVDCTAPPGKVDHGRGIIMVSADAPTRIASSFRNHQGTSREGIAIAIVFSTATAGVTVNQDGGSNGQFTVTANNDSSPLASVASDGGTQTTDPQQFIAGTEGTNTSYTVTQSGGTTPTSAYDLSWVCTVNGETVTPTLSDDGLTATVNTPAGEYGLEVWSLALAGESARAEQCIRANLWEILDAAEQGDWSLVDRVGEAEQPSLVDTLRWSVELTQRPGDESTARRTRDAARSLASARWSDPLHRICDLALATHALLLAGQSDEAADLWERNLELCVQLREQPEQAIGSAPFRALPVIQQAFVLGSLGRLRRAHNELRQTLRDWREGGEAHRDARLARDALLISARFRKLFGEPLTHAERESVEHFIPGAAYMGTLNLAAVRASEQLDADALVTAVSVAERREHEGAACVMVHFVRAVVGPAALSDDERSALRDPLAAHSFDGRAMARRATSWVESLATMDVAPLDEPRIRQAVHLARAIRAHRAGRPAYALSLLERAHEKRGGALAPIPLILCAKSERRALVHLASDAGNLTLATYLAVSSDWVDPTAGRDAEAPSLTRREGELLEMLRENKTVREIAEQSHLSVSTVKFHRANLYRKLGATSRDDALARTVLLFGER